MPPSRVRAWIDRARNFSITCCTFAGWGKRRIMIDEVIVGIPPQRSISPLSSTLPLPPIRSCSLSRRNCAGHPRSTRAFEHRAAADAHGSDTPRLLLTRSRFHDTQIVIVYVAYSSAHRRRQERTDLPPDGGIRDLHIKPMMLGLAAVIPSSPSHSLWPVQLFVVRSSNFSYLPGAPLFFSRYICHALNAPTMLNRSSLAHAKMLFNLFFLVTAFVLNVFAAPLALQMRQETISNVVCSKDAYVEL